MPDVATPRVDPSNAAQARAWDGEDGAYWAHHAERFERSSAGYDPELLAAAAIGPGASVLDVGCGTGGTTRAAARLAPGGTVLGVDLSARMIEVARALAERDGLANARFEQADAQVHPFGEGVFDVALSRTGAMFFGDPVAGFRNLARALRPDGRLALLVWQEPARNEWFREITTALAAGRPLPAPPPDAPGPFSMSDPARVRALLGRAGFAEVSVEGLHRPMWFGTRAADAADLVGGLMEWLLRDLAEPDRAGALAALRRAMATHETADGVVFDSAAWLVTAARR